MHVFVFEREFAGQVHRSAKRVRRAIKNQICTDLGDGGTLFYYQFDHILEPRTPGKPGHGCA
jgi:hypothetical protein